MLACEWDLQIFYRWHLSSASEKKLQIPERLDSRIKDGIVIRKLFRPKTKSFYRLHGALQVQSEWKWKGASSAYTVPYKCNQNESGGGTNMYGLQEKKKAELIGIGTNMYRLQKKKTGRIEKTR
jgi:hypothetical protein